jgi:hypothetical protein
VFFPRASSHRVFQPKTDKLQSGSQWLHEIKHDGFKPTLDQPLAHRARSVCATTRGAAGRAYRRPQSYRYATEKAGSTPFLVGRLGNSF